ncbi:hypothetical protein [Kitasatospora sp. NBC_01266]|uniref:hypothetical protein n=1 Tax=Kitasatospora sp. NBC_01266 TaxID=2903572 RepID=UPI002E315344|nr:hypothetical protein [Kitasatospora sp. NBC_01266]
MFTKAIFSAVAVAGLVLGAATTIAAQPAAHHISAAAVNPPLGGDTSWGDSILSPARSE